MVITIATVMTGCGTNEGPKVTSGLSTQTSANQSSTQTASAKDAAVQTSVDGYVATVGEQKITKDEFQFFLVPIMNQMEQQANVTDEEAKKTFWESSSEGQKPLEVAKEQALKTGQEFIIQLMKAKESGLVADQAEIDKMTEQIDTYIKSYGTEAGTDGTKEFEAINGISVKSFKAIYNDVVLVQKFTNEELKKYQASDSEMKKYFDDNIQKYQTVTVKHVLFLTQDSNTKQPLPQDKQDVAKKKAEDILAQVKAGADIAALAKQHSEDPGSKDNGGQYNFPRGQMVKEFEDWSFGAKVGDVGLVKTDYGYHVIKLEKIVGFNDVKEDIKKEVVSKKYYDMLEQWKNDAKYKLTNNSSVYDSIGVN